jgi:hypothetical protein
LYNLGVSAAGAGRIQDSAEALNKLITEFPQSVMVLDAGIKLSEVYLQKDPPDTDAAMKALTEAGRILRSRQTAVARARLGIALGKVEMAAGEPGKALSKWSTVALLKPENEEERIVVREAMILAIDEAVKQATAGDLDKWSIVERLTRLFVEYQPLDKMADSMIQLQTRATSLKPAN